MISQTILPLSAIFLAALLTISVVVSRPAGAPRWVFLAGMSLTCAIISLASLSLRAKDPTAVSNYQTIAMILRSFTPGCWLAFALLWARGDRRETLRRWRIPLALTFVMPVSLSLSASGHLIQQVAPLEEGGWWIDLAPAGQALNALLLIGIVLVLMTIEATFRAAVGTTRWRIKFIALGLATIFAPIVYTRSQALLYSGQTLAFASFESGALLAGSVLVAVGRFRRGFEVDDIYPARGSLGQSASLFITGGYLFCVGVLAQVIRYIGDAANFQAQALLVLLSVVAIGVLLMSDRVRQRLRHSFSRYFGKPLYDFRKVWTQFSEELSSQSTLERTSSVAASLIADIFSILSVRLWIWDEHLRRLTLAASTSPAQSEGFAAQADSGLLAALPAEIASLDRPFNLETHKGPLANFLQPSNPSQFSHGGDRLVVPIAAGARKLGLVVLADRVNGLPYTPEELDLLDCIARQIGAALLNVRITQELMQAKELEAFQTMSTFFVHDLKNAASTLNLMLQNLPIHFDNPEFRQDALRGIGKTVERVNHLITKLSTLRNKLDLQPIETDLNVLISTTLADLPPFDGIEIIRDFRATSKVNADPQQLASVVSNLVLNAREAIKDSGTIHIQTAQQDSTVTVSVSDSGCGMTPEFLASSLFRPFKSTKNKGLGIGMFQCKIIVEAHHGSIAAESTPGKGSTFRVSLPALRTGSQSG